MLFLMHGDAESGKFTLSAGVEVTWNGVIIPTPKRVCFDNMKLTEYQYNINVTAALIILSLNASRKAKKV